MSIEIKDIVETIGEVVSFPVVYARVNELMSEPDFSTSELSLLISQDPGLTIRLLQIANSPFYGLSREVDSISKAVTVLGTERIRELVLTTSASKVLASIPTDLLRIEDFWNHSILCGLISQYLASQCHGQDEEFAFVAGLLHDIGQLVLCNKYPGQYRVVFELMMKQNENLSLSKAEQKVFGFDHAELGAELMKTWHLSERLQASTRYHHELEKAEVFSEWVAMIYIANCLAGMIGVDDLNEEAINRIAAKAWEITGLSKEVVEPAVAFATERLSEVKASLRLE